MSDASQAASPAAEQLSAMNESNSESSESQVESSEGSNDSLQDVESQVEQVLTDPNATKAEKVQAQKMLKSLKIKFNGKEYDEELPFEIPDTPEAMKYMQNKLQMDKLARVKSQESANQQKMITEFMDALKKNPRKVLSDPSIGVDLKRIAAELIEEEIENSKKSPEQLEREKLENELKAMKEEREKEKDEFNKRELDRLQQQEFERYDMLMSKAIEKSDLPKSPYIIKKMADYMLMGLQKGIDVTPDDVLPLIREEMQNDLKEMFAVMPEDIIESIVGKENINRIRKKNLQRAKQSASVQQVSQAKTKDVGAVSQKQTPVGKKVKARDFFGF